MISEVYDALKDAGASEDKARKAAETLANTDNRFNAIDRELAVMKWMVGAALLGIFAPLAARLLGALS
jgi:hypothetical protein